MVAKTRSAPEALMSKAICALENMLVAIVALVALMRIGFCFRRDLNSFLFLTCLCY